MFLHQQVYRLLRDCQRPHRVLRFRLAYHQVPLDAVHLLCHRDGSCFNVQVSPEKGEKFAPPQTGSQFQVVCRQQATLLCFHQVRPDFLLRKHLHLLFLHFGQFTAPGWVYKEQPFLDRLFQAVVQQGVDAVDDSDTQALFLQLNVLISLHPAILLEVIVEFLDLNGGQLIQFDVAQLGDDVVVDVVQIVVLRFFS